MTSLRSRITVLATIVLVVVLAVAALVIVALVDRQLTNDLAAQNDETLDEVAAAIEAGTPPVAIRLPLGTDGTEFVITDAFGEFVQSTIVVFDSSETIPVDISEDGVVFAPPPGFVDEELPWFVEDISTWEATERTAVAPNGDGYVIAALTPNTIVDRNVRQVRSVLGLVIPALAAVFAALIWFLTGRMLRPVAQMTERANSIRTDTLHERLTEPGTDDEIDRLAVTLNSMLDRLDAGAKQQRDFVSDASHELQSPLTVMIGEAELAGASGDPIRLAEANERVIEQGRRLTSLIDDLLALARSGEAALRRIELDLDDVIRDEAGLQSRPIDTSRVDHVRMTGDLGALSRLIRNLLDNAARYADDEIVVAASAVGSTVTVTVDDDGPGVPADQRRRVFERFGRADESRARATGGTGLGLAISQAIVEAHGGEIVVGDSPLGGARLRVTLPV